LLNNFKYIIWDWNGTLFNDTELCVDIINGILLRRKLQTLTLKKYREIFTFPVKEYYRKTGLDFNKYSFEILGKEWMDEYETRKHEASLHEGAIDILKYISNRAKQQAILSAYSQLTLIEIVKYFNIDHYFTHLSGLDNIYAGSKIEIGKKLLTQLKCKPNETVLIGDTVHDYEVANELGIKCLLVANGHQNKEKLLTCNVKVLNSLMDLYKTF